MSLLRFATGLLVGLILAPVPQASAMTPSRQVDGTIAVTVPSNPLTINTGSCKTPVRYSVAPGVLPDGGFYDVTAKLRDHNGDTVGSDSSSFEESALYRGDIRPKCTKLESGRYTVEVTVDVSDENFDVVEVRTGMAKVRLKVTEPARTRLVVRKYAYGSRGWQWSGRLTSGGRAVAGQRIDLWWDLPGWENYEVSKRTNRNGIAHWVSNPNGGVGGIKFQLRFAGTDRYAPARSSIFDLAPR